MTHRVTVTLSITLRHEVPRSILKTYIKEAIETWQGQCFPGDGDLPPDDMWRAVKKATVRFAKRSGPHAALIWGEEAQ